MVATTAQLQNREHSWTHTGIPLPRARDPSTSSGDCVTYTYDGEGNIQTRTDAQGDTSYTYNRVNRLSSTTTPDASIMNYAYSPDGKMTKLEQKLPGNITDVVDYTHDKANLPQTVTDAVGTINITSDKRSRESTVTFPTTGASKVVLTRT